MKLELGPILYMGRSEPTRWRFHVNMLFQGGSADAPPPVVVDSEDKGVTVAGPVLAADFSDAGGRHCWRWTVTVKRATAERRISYRVRAAGGEVAGLPEKPVGPVMVPAQGLLPRMAFFSCNGVSSEKHFHRVSDPQGLWEDMVQMHRGEFADSPHTPGYHLLVGGGDQVYADSLWDDEPLNSLGRLSEKKRRAAPVPPGFETALRRMYVELYVKRWSDPFMREAMRCIPGVFTWDDHDIFDGWGSHDPELQASPCYEVIYRAAAAAFEAFQVGGTRDTLRLGDAGHFLQAASFHEKHWELDVLLLDLRSGRTQSRVLSDRQWDDVRAWLAGRAASTRRRHLVVVSTIPLVHLRFSETLDALPNLGGLDDDRIDQWEHSLHRGERARLMMWLLEHARDPRCRVTLLSGDVHVAAHGIITSTHPDHVSPGQTRTIIHQVTSSGIVNPPPSDLEFWFMRRISSDSREFIADEVYTEMLEVTTGKRYLNARNWLSTVFDEPGPSEQGPDLRMRMWMKWFTDKGGVEPEVRVEV
ncbi:MAG: alkaline phosphatase D family protein [Gemmatimonadota bacterium]